MRRLPASTPEIVNTDQGSQFTAETFTGAVLAQGCKLSMDGRGAWRDNVFIERVWRSVKYEAVYLKAYDRVSAARADIADYIDWDNTSRPHSSLSDATPEQAYLDCGWRRRKRVGKLYSRAAMKTGIQTQHIVSKFFYFNGTCFA